MTRRHFAFWIGMLLFWVSEKVHANFMDSAAAQLMTWADSRGTLTSERWQANENRSWTWFERQLRVDGAWHIVGITTPKNKITGEPYTAKQGYLDEALVPDDVVRTASEMRKKFAEAKVDETRRAEGGRPPSKWLRSLRAEELRIWLRTIDVPRAGVSGMTFWTHLTRDHGFSESNIQGLTLKEQAQLHAAAHHGY